MSTDKINPLDDPRYHFTDFGGSGPALQERTLPAPPKNRKRNWRIVCSKSITGSDTIWKDFSTGEVAVTDGTNPGEVDDGEENYIIDQSVTFVTVVDQFGPLTIARKYNTEFPLGMSTRMLACLQKVLDRTFEIRLPLSAKL